MRKVGWLYLETGAHVPGAQRAVGPRVRHVVAAAEDKILRRDELTQLLNLLLLVLQIHRQWAVIKSLQQEKEKVSERESDTNDGPKG